MLEFVASVVTNDDKLKLVFSAVREMKNLEVLVGIPEEDSSRPPTDDNKGSPATNAELLYIHTNGSPINNIPPRPVIEPAINDAKELISENLKQASISAFDGNIQGFMQNLEKAGLRGENAAKDWFTNPKNNWAPNSTITIEGTEAYKNGEKFIKGKKSSNPLIDTGELRKSITHVVRKK